MNRLLALLLLLLPATPLLARGAYSSYAERGGQTVVTNFGGSTIKGQQSCPGATITVRVAGTLTNTSLYSDSAGTAKSNPFTATTTGFIEWYAEDGDYDMLVSCGASWSYTVRSIRISGSAATVNVRNFGARGDTQQLDTGSMLSGSSTLSIGSALFVATDVGKRICISGAGAAGIPVCGTITALGSTTSVTTSFTNDSGGAISSKFVIWGTDDTAAFVAAEAAITTSNSSFYIPAGAYMVRSGQLTFNITGVHVRGDGRASIIYGADNDNNAFIVAAANSGIYSDFKVTWGNIDWTHTGQTIKNQSPGNDTIIQRVWFRSGYDLVYDNQLDNIKILDSEFEDSRRYAIYLLQGSAVQIRGNTFFGCSQVAIGGGTITGANIAIEHHSAAGYQYLPHHNIIEGNYFQFSKYGHFIRLISAEATKINGNFFQVASQFNVNTADAIKLENADGTVIDGNTSGTYYNGFRTATITGASNATPIVITAAGHPFVNAETVNIKNVPSNTAANGQWVITYIDANSFSLNGSVGNGASVSGGIANSPGTRYAVNIDTNTTDVRIVGNHFESGITGTVNAPAGVGYESIASEQTTGVGSLIQRALAGAFLVNSIRNTSPTGNARLVISVGDGTTATYNATILFQALASATRQWQIGMPGSAAFRVSNLSSGVTSIEINDTTDAVTFGGTITPDDFTFAALPSRANGTLLYCSDCLRGSVPCSGASTGSMAKREAGAWNCD